MQELLTAQHVNWIHTFQYHIVNFIKQTELLDALNIWEEWMEGAHTRDEYIQPISRRKLLHLEEALDQESTSAARREEIRKRLASGRRVLTKRYKASLDRADNLTDVYASVREGWLFFCGSLLRPVYQFGACVLLDPFWHCEWLSEVHHTKAFAKLVDYACQEHSLAHEPLADAHRVLRTLLIVWGDNDLLNMFDCFHKGHPPNQFIVEDDEEIREAD